MFAINYFGNNKKIVENIETEIENMGTQSRIYDYNTGLYARILPTSDGFTLAESGNTSCGFLWNLYSFGEMFDNGEEFEQDELMQKISAAIDGMNLTSDEVNELFQNGFLHMISKRNIEINENPDFQTVLRAEELCRIMENEGYITYSEVLEEIENRLSNESIDVKDKQILMALKQVYNNYMFKSSRENDLLLQEKQEKTPKRESVQQENVFYINGGALTKEQIIEGIKEDAFDYYELIDVIRQDKEVRDLVFSKLISLDYYSEEFKSYKKLLDEINEIRMKEADKEEKPQLQELKPKLSSVKMGEIDDLLKIKSIELENQKMSDLIKTYAKKMEELRPQGNQVNVQTMSEIDELQEEINSMNSKIDSNKKTIQESLTKKGFSPWLDYKVEFLEDLISSSHITEMEYEPEEYFSKMIKLFGEETLSDFVIEEYDEEVVEITKAFTIKDFIYGAEDKIIHIAETANLKKRILASKLSFLQEYGYHADIRQYIEEYAEAAEANGIEGIVFGDEDGFIDIERTIIFMPDDKNFYLVLAKYLKEMGMPLSTYMKYIPNEMVDGKFFGELEKVAETGEFTYQKEFSSIYEELISLGVLEEKEKELSRLEAEEKTISEAEALIGKQSSKTGEQK